MPAPMPAPMPSMAQPGAAQAHAPSVPQPVPAPAAMGAVPQPSPYGAPTALGQAPQPIPMPPAMPGAAPAAMPTGMAAPLGAGVPAAPIGMPPPEATVSALPLDEPPHEGGERALPGMTIHAFCDRQDTAGVINQSTQDWRMKRTTVKIFMGGLTAAIEFYRKETTPALIVIETGMRGPELFTQLETLASVCDENTKVVVIGAANDIRLYRQLMDAGVSDYIVPPFHPLGLIRSLSALYLDENAPFTGRVVAFFGASGGVGSSTISHNVAWHLAETLGQNTALVDLDCTWGTTGLDFHYDNSNGLDEALSDPSRLDETLLDRIMIRHTPHLSILPASGTIGHGIQNREAFEAVINGVRSISPLTILDMPHIWADWTEAVLTEADDVVITAALDLANLRNAKNLVDFLKAQRPNDKDPIVLLNKTGLSDVDIGQYTAMLGVEPAVTFPFQPDVFVTASNNGEMITDTKTAAGTIEGFQRIATRLKTGEFPVAPSRPALSLGKKGKDKAAKSQGKPKGKEASAEAGSGESKSFIMNLLKRG